MIIGSWTLAPWVLVYFSHALICAIVAALIAGSRDRNRIDWALGGFAFGLFAVLVVAVLGEPRERDRAA